MGLPLKGLRFEPWWAKASGYQRSAAAIWQFLVANAVFAPDPKFEKGPGLGPSNHKNNKFQAQVLGWQTLAAMIAAYRSLGSNNSYVCINQVSAYAERNSMVRTAVFTVQAMSCASLEFHKIPAEKLPKRKVLTAFKPCSQHTASSWVPGFRNELLQGAKGDHETFREMPVSLPSPHLRPHKSFPANWIRVHLLRLCFATPLPRISRRSCPWAVLCSPIQGAFRLPDWLAWLPTWRWRQEIDSSSQDLGSFRSTLSSS